MANPAARALLRREDDELIGRALGELGSPLADRLAIPLPPAQSPQALEQGMPVAEQAGIQVRRGGKPGGMRRI